MEVSKNKAGLQVSEREGDRTAIIASGHAALQTVRRGFGIEVLRIIDIIHRTEVIKAPEDHLSTRFGHSNMSIQACLCRILQRYD